MPAEGSPAAGISRLEFGSPGTMVAHPPSSPAAVNPPATPASDPVTDAMALNAMQLLLAEKRTALSGLRTGIAAFALPLSVLSVLIATSRSYDTERVLHWLLPLLAICLGLFLLAVYLAVRSVRKIWHYDRMIHDFQQQHSVLAPLME